MTEVYILMIHWRGVEFSSPGGIYSTHEKAAEQQKIAERHRSVKNASITRYPLDHPITLEDG